MNVKIVTEAAQFPEKEYINGNRTFIFDSHRPFICSVGGGGLFQPAGKIFIVPYQLDQPRQEIFSCTGPTGTANAGKIFSYRTNQNSQGRIYSYVQDQLKQSRQEPSRKYYGSPYLPQFQNQECCPPSTHPNQL